ncbi:hypothetical protein MNBD_GAMMA09-125 [hydrothermal vent metagenome]|uniref:Lipoprotein n=1 Tax=hydrothermal vent metagenome TaxID=652676 RepID=A0A3B0YA33_9ZZZZ
MRGMQRLFIILMLLGTLIACSGTAKGPISKREYKVQVGGWQDMDEYNQKRDKAIENKDRSEDDIIDCNVVDCPEMIRDTP